MSQSKKTVNSGREENDPAAGHDRVILMAVRTLVMGLRLSLGAEIITIWLLWVTSQSVNGVGIKSGVVMDELFVYMTFSKIHPVYCFWDA